VSEGQTKHTTTSTKAEAMTIPFAEREPHKYFAVVARMKRLIAKAEAAGYPNRAARLRVSLQRYQLTANSSYGAIRLARPRTDDLR
jgi:hypothetical protein